MIKPGEYIQILEFFIKQTDISSELFSTYSIDNNIDYFETIQRLDELRCLHGDFAKECELYSVYKNLDLKKLNLYKENIAKVCEKFNIKVKFINFDSLAFRKGCHASYTYRAIDISDLFVFYIKRKRSYVSNI